MPVHANLGHRFQGNATPAVYGFFQRAKTIIILQSFPEGQVCLGVSISGTTLTVKQSGTPLTSDEYAAMNGLGDDYCYILFR
jgi:hypothetical protein